MHTYSITIDDVTKAYTANTIGEAIRQWARQQGLGVSSTFSIGDLLEMTGAPVTIREDGEVVSSHADRRRRSAIETRQASPIGEACAEGGPDEIIALAERGWPEGAPAGQRRHGASRSDSVRSIPYGARRVRRKCDGVMSTGFALLDLRDGGTRGQQL